MTEFTLCLGNGSSGLEDTRYFKTEGKTKPTDPRERDKTGAATEKEGSQKTIAPNKRLLLQRREGIFYFAVSLAIKNQLHGWRWKLLISIYC